MAYGIIAFFIVALLGATFNERFTEALLPGPADIASKDVEAYITSGIHKGCGKTKGCLPNSEECVERKNCRVVVTYQSAPPPFQTDYYKFELLGRISRKELTGYIALGISVDAWMGADLVLACVLSPTGATEIQTYWNTERNPQTSKLYTFRVDLKQGSRFECGDTRASQLIFCKLSIYTIGTGKFIYCSFYLKKYVELHDKLFDMENYPFYLLRARGFEVTASGIAMHKETMASDSQVELWNPAQDHEQRRFMQSGHAVMMIGVILVLLPNGFMVARFFKESVVHYKFLGRRPYQLFHMGFMFWATFLTLVSLLNLHSYKGAQNMFQPSHPNEDSFVHAYVGSVSTWTILLMVLFNGLCCWCGPRREHAFFPISHFLLGNLAYTTGLYVLLTSHRMKTSWFPCDNGFVVLASVLWTLIWNVLFTIHRRRTEVAMTKKKASIRSLLPLPLPEISAEEAPFLKTRLIYMTVHLLGTVVLGGVVIGRYLVNLEPCYCRTFICLRTENPTLRFPSTET